MGRTVAELGEVLSEEEWTEWLAYNHLEPFGRPVEDDYKRTELTLFWMANNTDANASPPKFFDRDPQPIEQPLSEMSLDDQIVRAFAGNKRVKNANPNEPQVNT